MLQLSTAMGWIIDLWAVILTAIIFIINWQFKPNNKQLVMASLMVVLMYAIGHFVYAWIISLQWDEQVQYRYSSRLLLYVASTLFYGFFILKVGPSFTSSFIFVNLSVCIILQFLMHVDRNVVGLNHIGELLIDGELIINTEYQSYWWLWDAYTLILNVSSALIIAYLLIGESLKEYICSRYY
tara:strand:- start:2405 stop:2953 length:549 start_codon:yes stop_codon:yes gene_type:complete